MKSFDSHLRSVGRQNPRQDAKRATGSRKAPCASFNRSVQKLGHEGV